MESGKRVLMNYLQGSSVDADTENGLWTQWGKTRVGRIERVALKRMHYHV